MKNKSILTLLIAVLVALGTSAMQAQNSDKVTQRNTGVRVNRAPIGLPQDNQQNDTDPEVDEEFDEQFEPENNEPIFLDPEEEFRRQEEQYRRSEIDFQRSERDRQRSEVEYTFNEIERTFNFRESGEALNSLAYKNVDKALYGFLQTDFMRRFRDLKFNAENEVGRFKSMSNQLEPEQVARVKSAYTKIAHQFNQELEAIKRDFLDRKKMKLIKNNKEMYTNSLRYRFQELQDDYSQNFLRILVETTGDDRYASATIAAIFGLIRLTRDITNFLLEAKHNARMIKEEHLNRFLIEPHSFKPWYEVEMINANAGFGDFDSGYDTMNESETPTDGDFEEMVPWDEEDSTELESDPIDNSPNR